MSRTEGVADRVVILGALILVFDQQRDRRARGHLAAVAVGDDARKNADGVGFFSLGGEAGLPRLALVEEPLDVGFAQRDQRRTAVDDAANRAHGFRQRS